MTVSASRVKTLIDVATSVTLRAITAGAITATATEASVSLYELDKAYWDVGTEIPFGVVQVMYQITACDGTSADETYVLSLLVDDAAAMNDSPVTVHSMTVPRGFTGILYALVDAESIPLLDPDHSTNLGKFMSVRATLGGTTPSLTYGATIVKNLKG